MADETFAVDKAVYQKLFGDAPLMALIGNRIYSEIVPEDGDYPCVLFAHYNGVDTNAIGRGSRLLSRLQYVIRAVTKGEDTFANASSIASKMDDLLLGMTQDVVLDGKTYHIGGMDRIRSLRSQEVDDGVRYNYLGGVYETFVNQ